jgi:putative ABC transport system permease protein
VLLGREPIGRQVKINTGTTAITEQQADSLPWVEIVGVVKDLGMIGASESIARAAGVYMPARPGSDFAPEMMIHTRGDPMSLVPRVRSIAATVNPTLRLAEFQSVDQVSADEVWVLGMWLRATLLLTGVALLLSLACMRWCPSPSRDARARSAFARSRRGVLGAVFSRPLTQVSLGVAAGAILIGLGAEALSITTQFREHADRSLGKRGRAARGLRGVHAGVCLLACVVPSGARSGWKWYGRALPLFSPTGNRRSYTC